MNGIKSTAFAVKLFVAIVISAGSLNAAEPPKVLYVDSYHSGYEWSDGIIRGIFKGFGLEAESEGRSDFSNARVRLKVVRMDTKRNNSESFKRQAAAKVRKVIDEYGPDIVIASDDNASKYVIAPHYVNKALPFVFCGVNWDASVYGFPASNITGMEEVSLAVQTLEMLKKYAKGSRVGIITADTLSERKTVENIKRKFNLVFHREYFTTSFEQWKKQFVHLQDEVDMVLFTNNIGIQGWEPKAARQHIEAHIKIPIGTMDTWVTPYALIGLAKTASEQGEWAAQTALRILDGESPRNIPIATNQKADIYLNMGLAKALEVEFPMDLLSWVNLVE